MISFPSVEAAHLLQSLLTRLSETDTAVWVQYFFSTVQNLLQLHCRTETPGSVQQNQTPIIRTVRDTVLVAWLVGGKQIRSD